MQRHFASDNNAGIHPEVLRAIAEANEAHAPSYGADPYTARAEGRLREIFGGEARPFLVFGGTAANVLALRHLTRDYDGIVCPWTAHINVDECGALESAAGRKLIPLATADGKLTPDMLRAVEDDRGDAHRVQPRVVSVAQASEYGTVYTAAELRALCDAAHAAGMLVHVDGARLANAAAALETDLRAITRDCGVDALTFGGTKNGLMGAEAVIFFEPSLAEGFQYARKQLMQLASKMRFLAVQFEALLADELWRRSAAHANAMAALLLEELGNAVEVTQQVETNAVFARMPAAAIERLQRTYRFGIWNRANGEVRFMTAWDTTEEDVRAFARAVRNCVKDEG